MKRDLLQQFVYRQTTLEPTAVENGATIGCMSMIQGLKPAFRRRLKRLDSEVARQ
jgi:hypothetical protein